MEYDNVDDCVKNLDDLDAEFKLLDVSVNVRWFSIVIGDINRWFVVAECK